MSASAGRLAALLLFSAASSVLAQPHFDVRISPALTNAPATGRLFVILSRSEKPEPRLTLTRTGLNAPFAFAEDVTNLAAGSTYRFGDHLFGFPQQLTATPPGGYWVQALLDANTDLRLPDSPGNLYSAPQAIHFDPQSSEFVKLELSRQIPPEQVPLDTAQIKYVRLQSKLLSDFFKRPMYLRAGIILPRDYDNEPGRKYPLWVRIGGFGTRYTAVGRMMSGFGEFHTVLQAADTPRFILMLVDGAGPYGDPYYVNSANNGPYGDALVQELIPFVEQKFRAMGEPRARVLSGVSTGGWVSLALQVFYPDFFNGTWSSCPDPVDFRAFELVNIYSNSDAYVNAYGNERPSERDLKGDVVLTMRREVGVENLLGGGNSYTRSGQQWGSWDAVYSPRAADGGPAPLWDAHTGRINPEVAEAWRKYDLRLLLEENWATLGPKLRGKIHIASGEADQYFLNNAAHLLNDFLTTAQPPFEGRIVFSSGKGHGWSDVTLRQMLDEMHALRCQSP
ncbi:MAG: alpha/beta hydrolase-fold protein [Limisphaerales bacterium]